ncbi:MAG: hypothetical protein AB7G44_04350 [Bacteroidia bacterium]
MLFQLLKFNENDITGFVDFEFKFLVKQGLPEHTVKLSYTSRTDAEQRLQKEKISTLLARLSFWEKEIFFLSATPGYYNTADKKVCFQKFHDNLVWMCEKQSEETLEKFCRMTVQLEPYLAKLLPGQNDKKREMLNNDMNDILRFARTELGHIKGIATTPKALLNAAA